MRFFVRKCRLLRQVRPETGKSLVKFENYSQLPNIVILLSSFGSLSQYLKVHKVDI